MPWRCRLVTNINVDSRGLTAWTRPPAPWGSCKYTILSIDAGCMCAPSKTLPPVLLCHLAERQRYICKPIACGDQQHEMIDPLFAV